MIKFVVISFMSAFKRFMSAFQCFKAMVLILSFIFKFWSDFFLIIFLFSNPQ